MSNSEYWRKRFEQVTESELKKADMYQKILEREYQKAIVQIQKDIDTWYNRFAKDNKVTYAESKRMLNSKELQELKWTLDDYIKHGEENNINGKWVQQLKNASARVHISRLESLQIQLQQHAEVVFGNQLDDLDDVLRDIYESGYYHSIFEIQKGLGLGSSFTKLDTARINKVLSKPWADDGRDFSKRIWSNRTKLVNELHTGLTQALIRGEPVEKLAKRLSERFDVSKNRAVALVQTESAYFANAAQQDSFKEIGVDKLEIVGTLDGHTCSTCGAMDGKVIDGSDAKPGITTPPYHTRCRCCTAPAVDEKIGERVAKDAGGTNYGVPADMTFEQWYEKYVKGKGASNVEGNNKKSSKKIGVLDYSDKKAIMKKIREFESSVLDLDYERNISICKDGSVWVTEGDSANVFPGLIETMTEGTTLKGSYSYHNHPKNETYFSFSADDVAFFISYGEHFAMASDHMYEYFMQRLDDTIEMAYDDVKYLFKDIRTTHTRELTFNGEIDPDMDEYHATMEEVQQRLHFKYWRVKK